MHERLVGWLGCVCVCGRKAGSDSGVCVSVLQAAAVGTHSRPAGYQHSSGVFTTKSACNACVVVLMYLVHAKFVSFAII